MKESIMSNFDEAIKVVLIHEGGFVDHPSDPGGATNYGVSLRFLKGLSLEFGDINKDGVINVEDIKNMNICDAQKVYKSQWWDKYKYGMIVDQTIATKIFDFSVNMGARQAHKLLQRAINEAFGMNLTVDGIIGPATRGVINSANDDIEQELLTAYAEEAWKFYQLIMKRNPRLKAFQNGWKKRAYSLTVANSMG